MTHLFQFTIGPVQSFISQARKMQDLYAGSQLLAELCKVATDAAAKEDIQIIFPQKVAGVNSVPNRFIGKIEGIDDQAVLRQKGERIEKAVKERFKLIAQDALRKAGIPFENRPPGFGDQIDHHLEIYWLFYPQEGEYKEAYENLEKYLGALKNIRPFVQLPETGRKCSLDGERNALFFGDGSNKNFIDENKATELSANDSWMSENEGLSAVSFVKRHYDSKERPDFESTAGIALASYIENKVDQTAYKTYKVLFNGGRQFDEQLCYEENITEKYFKKQGLRNVLKKNGGIESIKEQRQRVFGRAELPKYYAVLAFDGDSMGKIVGGHFLTSANRLEKFQERVSVLLGEFAKTAQGLVKYPHGQTIYAGGDDFLGLITMDKLFYVLKELRTLFESEVNQKLKAEFSADLKPDFNFTFSAGLAIAHYKMPLHFVLEKVREMEKKAKNAGRNRLAFAALKHSGEGHEAIVEWDLQLKDQKWHSQSLTFIEEMLKDLRKRGENKQANFSDTFLRSFEREMAVLQDKEGKLIDGGREALKLLSIAKAEMNRLIKRSVNKKDLPPKERDEACARMENNILYLMAEKQQTTGITETDVDNFSELMKVILFINRESTQL